MTSAPTVCVGGIRYETNSFAPAGAFDLSSLRVGPDVLDALPSTELAGAIRTARQRRVELIGLLDVFGGCGGPIEHVRYERLATDLVGRVRAAKRPDGIYLALHGAMATTETDAAEADLVGRIRAEVGADVPIVASFDLHAAVDDALAALLDGIVGFKTCPHVDYEQTGALAMTMLARAVRGESLAVHHHPVPMVTAAEAHDTFDGPLAPHMGAALGLVGDGIVDVSIFAVQPWLDAARTSWSVTVTYTAPVDASRAADVANALGASLLADREAFVVDKTPPASVASMVEPGAPAPLLIADSGDSPSAGATGGSTDVLGHLTATAPATVLATVTDPEAARTLAALPVGRRVPIALGGMPTLGIEPLELTVELQSVHDGRYERAYPAAEVDAGCCVVVVRDSLTLVVTERPVFMLDVSVFEHVGIDPRSFDAVQVKSAGGFRAKWAPLSTSIVTVGSRGASTSALETLPYRMAPVDTFVLRSDIDG